jgi:HEAT repeats
MPSSRESRVTEDEPESLGDRVLGRYEVMMGEDVTPVLRELGFTGTRRKFTMRRNGACGVLAWQKDSRAYRYGEVRFTANMDWWCGSGRIGELIPACHPDIWWTVTAGEPAATTVLSVLTAIRCFALPAILAGLDDPAPQPKGPAMHGPWAGPEPDGGGTEPGAWFIQPARTSHDPWFAGFASDEPRDRLHAAYLAVTADGDKRTVPALLDRLEHEPDPAVRKLIASRMLPRLGHDPRVRPALRRTAAEDNHPGVRWAGRYALRIIETR